MYILFNVNINYNLFIYVIKLFCICNVQACKPRTFKMRYKLIMRCLGIAFANDAAWHM